MLTADLVRARRRGDELSLAALDARARQAAGVLAQRYIELARAGIGSTRADFSDGCAQVPVAARDRKLAAGLRKLVEDRCEFESGAAQDPRALRAELFAAASSALRAAPQVADFDRAAWLTRQAEQRGMTLPELERALYADLRGEQILCAFEELSAERLVQRYEAAQAQAVLLRAVGVVARVYCSEAYGYRQLFRKLKFLRLLHEIRPLAASAQFPQGGYEIGIDGPFSMFSQVTKYGLQLALALPAVQDCERFSVQAQVRWGQQRQPLRFRLQGGEPRGGAPATSAARTPGATQAALPDEVRSLLERLSALDSPWRVEACREILELRGLGVIVPDLLFVHARSGRKAYLEVLGYWSRDAVWKRVELVEQGLEQTILFAVSKRLRVSEQVLDQNLPGELYVYKNTMSAREILSRLERKHGGNAEQLSLG